MTAPKCLSRVQILAIAFDPDSNQHSEHLTSCPDCRLMVEHARDILQLRALELVTEDDLDSFDFDPQESSETALAEIRSRLLPKETDQPETLVRPPRRIPPVLALAAAIALMITGGIIWFVKQPGSVAPLHTDWPQSALAPTEQRFRELSSGLADEPNWKDSIAVMGVTDDEANATVILLSDRDSRVGSGVVVSRDGWVLTTLDALGTTLQDASLNGQVPELNIRTVGGLMRAQVYRVDTDSRVALLRITTPLSKDLIYRPLADSFSIDPKSDYCAIGAVSNGPVWLEKCGRILNQFEARDLGNVIDVDDWAPLAPNTKLLLSAVRSFDGFVGGPLFDKRGHLIGLTLVTSVDLNRDQTLHLGWDALNGIYSDLPSTPELIPPDFWIGPAGSDRYGPRLVDRDNDARVDGVGFYFARTLDGSDPRVCGVTAYIDVDDEQASQELEDQPDSLVPFGTGSGQFQFDVAVMLMPERGVAAVAYAGPTGLIQEIRIAHGSADTTSIGLRRIDSRWIIDETLAGAPLVDQEVVSVQHINDVLRYLRDQLPDS